MYQKNENQCFNQPNYHERKTLKMIITSAEASGARTGNGNESATEHGVDFITCVAPYPQFLRSFFIHKAQGRCRV